MSERWADASGTQPKTRQEWFQELAADALREGQAALGAGDLLRARSWLGHAHRIPPTDFTASLSRSVLLLRASEPAPAPRLRAVTWDGGRRVGSPIDLARIRRVEAGVRVAGGGLSGWAWARGNPELDPTLTVRGADGGCAFDIRADDVDVVVTHALSRPRGFRVPPERLAGLSGMVHVTGSDGRDIAGSPLDPGAEARAAATVAQAVARLFPLVGLPAPRLGDAALAQASLPADPHRPAANVPAQPGRRIGVVGPVHDAPRTARD